MRVGLVVLLIGAVVSAWYVGIYGQGSLQRLEAQIIQAGPLGDGTPVDP
jgi:hypothetical protein